MEFLLFVAQSIVRDAKQISKAIRKEMHEHWICLMEKQPLVTMVPLLPL